MHLYIHIPFCASKCAYCDFNSYPISTFENSVINEYVETVLKEIQNVRKTINKKHVNLKTIYIGGGTPSILSETHLKTIIFSIREHFGLKGSLEFSIECNPESVTREKLRFYKGMGVNRISLGVQTFYDDILKMLDRPCSTDDTVKAIECIKKESITNFSFDLIFALPHQTMDMFQKDLEKALTFSPPHISLYCMTLGYMAECNFKNKKLNIPGEDEQINMYREGVRFLNENGYEKYEISNFSKKGFNSQHNLSYWQHKEYIGVGAGASSYLNGFRFKNIANVNDYISNIKQHGNAISEKKEITEKEAKAEFVFLSLRLSGGLDFDRYKNKFASNFPDDFQSILEDWKDKDMYAMTNSNIKLTDNGVLLSDEFFRDLF